MAAAYGEKWASRVIVQMPPRHGKSEFISKYFLAWFLGTFPDRKAILASYSDTFAAQWGMQVRDLLEEFGPDLFGIRVRQDARARAQWRILGRRGAMYTAGVQGSLTGRGGHIAVIDDPIKNDKEALSPTVREGAKNFYRSTLRTRMERADAPIIVVMTRWHQDDLAGWLQTEYPDDWLVISLPAFAEDDEELELPGQGVVWQRSAGEALWPEKYDAPALRSMQHEMGGSDGYWWTALYQQRPTPLGGGILKPERLRRFTLVDDGYLLDTPAGPLLIPSAGLARFGTMDLAVTERTSSDWTVIAVCAVVPPNLLVLDVLRWRSEGPELPGVAAAVVREYGLGYLAAEAIGVGLPVVQDMVRGNPLETPPRPPLPVKAIVSKGDKVTAALVLATRMGSGHVYFPDHAPWLAQAEAEMAMFPKGDHDDVVDALSAAAIEQMEFGDDVLRSA
jgi:predicted phage terminase large subunit-like protein